MRWCPAASTTLGDKQGQREKINCIVEFALFVTCIAAHSSSACRAYSCQICAWTHVCLPNDVVCNLYYYPELISEHHVRILCSIRWYGGGSCAIGTSNQLHN